MKQINKNFLFVFLLVAISMAACKKDKTGGTGGNIETGDYIFNNVLKTFNPSTITGTARSQDRNAIVFYYLKRDKKTDTLIKQDYLSEKPSEYNFSFSNNEMQKLTAMDMSIVTGIRVLIRNENQTTYEKTMKITYYDPAAPQLSNFVTSLTPTMPGLTDIKGTITSEPGLAKVYFYDDSTGAYTVIDSISVNNSKDYSLDYKYAYRMFTKNLKVEAVDIYGLKSSTIITFTNVPFNPSITPSAEIFYYALPDGGAIISGSIECYSNISEIKVYQVKGARETLISPAGIVVPAAKTYDFSITDFPYEAGVDTCKIVVKDDAGRTGTSKITLNELPYYYWKNVTMTAQGNATGGGTASFFVGGNIAGSPTLGNCEVVGAGIDSKIDFFVFCNSSNVFSFYNPSPTSASTISSYRCSGTSWAPTTSNLRTTYLKVVAAGNNLYSKYPNLSDLSTASTGLATPTSGNTAQSSSFNVSSAYLINGTINPPSGGAAKNILIKVNSLNIQTNPDNPLSTINIDIMKEK